MKKSYLSFYAFAAAAAVLFEPFGPTGRVPKMKNPPAPPPPPSGRFEGDPIDPIKKGLKCFRYGPNHVWALNQKNADKKAIKNGWIPF